ncbi:MAG: DoxX family membrane protein [Prevotella nigrescens]|jgi:doxX family protein|uniref:DoxX family membrane protein n=1 Tax=Prevotella nigrescens TaxID=28133 RepID=A0A9D5WYW8_9BACT|nr:DoxX family membrane protein [Prevotella nigrescens]MBF1446407.1 DoxX family membrane protein [Prevotella nigrescens]
MIELRQIAKLFLRLTIVASMLSSVADRFGIWAKELCTWGDMDKFVAYTQSLIPYIPANAVPVLAWTATVLEVLLPLCLLVGLKLKWTASLSGLMILVFAIAMATSVGIKAPLNYSTFTASAAAFGILACGKGIWEVDNLMGNRRHNDRRIQMIR